MQLLSKNEIIKYQNDDKKLQIDNGVRIAKKVDELRSTLSIEEDKLATFRTTTINAVTKEIDALIEKKSSVASEILALEEVKNRMLLPITTEQKKLDILKEDNSNLLESIRNEKRELSIIKNNVENETKQSKSLLDTLEKTKQELNSREKTVSLKEKQVQGTLFEAQQDKINFEKEYYEKTKVLEDKIQRAAIAEADFKNFISNLKQKEKELDILLTRYGNNRSK